MMDYNTQRKHLKFTDYGRSVTKLIDYVSKIEDREQRNLMAEGIVTAMAQVNPKVREQADYRHKLWDHMLILAEGKLDVDWPADLGPDPRNEQGLVPEVTQTAPHKLSYKDNKITYRHYGKVMEDMIKRVAEYPEGEEKELLTSLIAKTMKRSYLLWNSDNVENQVILNQLQQLSGGALSVDAEKLEVSASEVKEIKEELKPQKKNNKKK